jgi:hypothetical protein
LGEDVKISRKDLSRLWSQLDQRHFDALDKRDFFAAKAFELLRSQIASGGTSIEFDADKRTPRDVIILEWAVRAGLDDNKARELYEAENIRTLLRMFSVSKKDVSRSTRNRFVSLETIEHTCAMVIRRAHRVWKDANIKAQKLPAWVVKSTQEWEP